MKIFSNFFDKSIAFVAETLYNKLDKCRGGDRYKERRMK